MDPEPNLFINRYLNWVLNLDPFINQNLKYISFLRVKICWNVENQKSICNQKRDRKAVINGQDGGFNYFGLMPNGSRLVMDGVEIAAHMMST